MTAIKGSRKQKTSQQAGGKKLNSSPIKSVTANGLLIALSIIVPLLFFEALMGLILHYPSFGNWGSLKIAKQIYENDYRNIIQFEPAFARYDAELTYTLKPGHFHFSNPEFNVAYEVNRLGLRDSDASLTKPDVIVIGDSEAMGWGVPQTDTYAKYIEQKSRFKVLNAAVSSYGTVREMRLLDRLDLSNAKILIIHYMQNDDIENHFFAKNRNVLRISSQETYEETRQLYRSLKAYYPGKYIRLSLRYGLGMDIGPHAAPKGAPSSIELHDSRERLFLNAVMHASHADLTRMQIVVLNTDADATFSMRLREEIQKGDYPPHIKKIKVLHPVPKMDRQCFFTLDEHMRVKGHAVVADELFFLLTSRRF